MTDSYREYAPSPALAPYVECFWSRIMARRDHAKSAAPHTVLPDGCMDVVFNFSEGGDSSPVHRGGAVLGTMTTPLLVSPVGSADFFGVRFRPGMAQAILRAPAAEFTDRAVAIADVWGREGNALKQQLVEATRAHARVAIMERNLLRRLPSLSTPDPRVLAAVQLILQSRGALSIAAASSFAGITRQHLARQFAEHLGVSPKLFSRVVRFQSLLARLRTPPHSWSQLAADAGYYDQSHLIADFRQFAGATPEAFLASRSA